MSRYVLAAVIVTAWSAGARAEVPEENRPVVAYLENLQARSGGFLPRGPSAGEPPPTPTLQATAFALRALELLGADVTHRADCGKFVAACFDQASGGFADAPGGKPTVVATCAGLKAVAVLKAPHEKYSAASLKYLAGHVRSFEDVARAVSALEEHKLKAPDAGAWLEKVTQLRQPDGTYGKGEGLARETAVGYFTAHALGGKAEGRQHVIKALKAAQRDSGGYGRQGAENADLESTYLVMRALVSLGERPSDVEGVRSFVAKCRNEDGGYSPGPGEQSSVSATYHAAAINSWLARN